MPKKKMIMMIAKMMLRDGDRNFMRNQKSSKNHWKRRRALHQKRNNNSRRIKKELRKIQIRAMMMKMIQIVQKMNLTLLTEISISLMSYNYKAFIIMKIFYG
jgi:hypothetical protein